MTTEYTINLRDREDPNFHKFDQFSGTWHGHSAAYHRAPATRQGLIDQIAPQFQDGDLGQGSPELRMQLHDLAKSDLLIIWSDLFADDEERADQGPRITRGPSDLIDAREDELLHAGPGARQRAATAQRIRARAAVAAYADAERGVYADTEIYIDSYARAYAQAYQYYRAQFVKEY